MNKHIVIVGLGLIGGSLAKAFAKDADTVVTGLDQQQAVVQQALQEGTIAREASLDDLHRADLVYLCLYPEGDLAFVKAHLHDFGPQTVVTDVCGIKSIICPALTALAEQGPFLFCGSHPMAGTEAHGYSASRADLFQGASYLIIPCSAPNWAIQLVEETALQLGFSQIVHTTPEHHDAMIAFTSQVPHALACAYVMSPHCPEHRGFSAGSYRDVSRVANINEPLWAELFLDNQLPLTEELSTLIDNLSKIRDAVAQGNRPKLEAFLRQGRLIKEALGE